MPTDEGYLEPEGLEKTWMVKQESIIREVDVISSRKPFDMILPGKICFFLFVTKSQSGTEILSTLGLHNCL